MTSGFKFEGYKIDEIDLKMRPDVGLVVASGYAGGWNFNLQIRQPYFFPENNLYVGGLSFSALMFSPSEKKEDRKPESALVTLKVGIAGAFTTDGQFPTELEEKLVSNQIPAILLPYLRAAISNVTSNSGFAPMIVPLMNIQKWAEAQHAKLKVEIVHSGAGPAAISSKPDGN